jgi:hypothetical protein
LGASLLPASSLTAGPWAAGKGHSYTKITYSHLRSTTLVSPDGTSFDIPRFTKDDVDIFAAYGVSRGVTALASIPLVRSSNLRDDPDELHRETGIGDVAFGAQVQLGRRGPWVFAVRGVVQVPSGDETRAQGLLPTGSGVWEGQAVLSAGRSFAGGKGYGFVEVGPAFRGGGLRDGVVYAAQVGWNTNRRIVFAVNLRGVEPRSHEAPEIALGSFSGVGDRVTYLALGPTVIVGLTRSLALQMDGDAAFHSRNLAEGPTLRVGISFTR